MGEGYFGLGIPEIECYLIKKNGERIDMPNIYVAMSFTRDIWKDQVDRIETKQIYRVGE